MHQLYKYKSHTYIHMYIFVYIYIYMHVCIYTYVHHVHHGKKRRLIIVTQINVFIGEVSNICMHMNLTAITPFYRITMKVSRRRRSCRFPNINTLHESLGVRWNFLYVLPLPNDVYKIREVLALHVIFSYLKP